MAPTARRLLLLLAAIPALVPRPAPAQAVPETIRAEGVPAVPAALVRELNRYQNVRTAGFASWATGRREVYVLTRFGATNQVHRVAMPLGARTQVTFEPERVLGAAARPGRPQFLLTMDEGGAENYQLFLFDEPTGTITRLTDGKARHTAPRWSPSGRLLAFSSNARNGQDMDLYVLDPDAKAPARLVKEVSGDWSAADWSPDEATLAAVESISINEAYVHLVNVADGATRTLTARPEPGAPKVAYERVRWAKDGKALFVTTDRDAEFLRLVRLDVATGAHAPIGPGVPWDVEAFDLSDDGTLIAMTTNEGGPSRLRVVETAGGAERRAPTLPVGLVSDLEFRPGSHEVGFTLASARSPADAHSIDLDAPAAPLVRWTASETGGLDPRSFPEPELVTFRSFDGREIPAFLYRPDPSRFAGPRPVLVNIHGGPEGQSRPGFLGRANYLVAELGIAILYPNVRGSSGYGKGYLMLDNGMRREDAVKDVGALLDWIKVQPNLDATRVAVTGGSYGGFMSLAVQTAYNDRIRAGIDIVGISNFVTFLRNTQAYRRDLRRAEYGDERDAAMREFLERVSPLTHAAKIRTPILVVQGRNDPRVPMSEADQVVAAVRRNGVPVWYVVGTNEGHGFAKRPNQDYLQAVEVLFLRAHLLGEAPPPAAAGREP
jgi:dipeptidyl aminopeptidase/acylaminoacyl peptidase